MLILKILSKDLTTLYQGIGYECLSISAKTGENIEAVKKLMTGKSSMFAGHSGVGKSTLVNSIEPGLNIKTKEISDQHKQGQHTTTFAEMFDLSFEAQIIDTPGIKGFGVVDMEPAEVDNYFPELFALKQSCKFNNCLHLHEPQCAVKSATSKTMAKSQLPVIKVTPKFWRAMTSITEPITTSQNESRHSTCVTEASVSVDGRQSGGHCSSGLVVLLGITDSDTTDDISLVEQQTLKPPHFQ